MRLINYISDKIKPHAAKRESVANAEARMEECANADLEQALETDEDGWFKCSNYGTFPGSKPGRMQHFGKPEAERMVAEFNSLRGKLGRMFRGLPIFIGHPDVNRTVWPDERRLGKVVEMQARADGFWNKGEWNALGRENIENGYWVYPSPRWDAPEGHAEFRPDRLLSVGLTNMPRIKTSDPIANAADADEKKTTDLEEQAAGAEKISTNETTETKDMDRKLLIEKLGLPAEATDEEILAKLDEVLQANTDADTAEKAKLDAAAATTEPPEPSAEEAAAEKAAEEALKKAREGEANARVDLAIAEGKITLAERPMWLGRMHGERREEEMNALGALTPKLNTTRLSLAAAKTEVGDEHKRREAVANAVAKVMEEKNCSYSQAYATVRQNPAMKATFEAMKEPGREEE